MSSPCYRDTTEFWELENDRATKADIYAALGVGELWLIDTKQQTVEQRVLGPGGWVSDLVHTIADTVHAVRLPGFTCAVRAVFA